MAGMENLNRRDLLVALSAFAAVGGGASEAGAQAKTNDVLDKSKSWTFESLPVKQSANGGASRAVVQGVLATGEAVEVFRNPVDAATMLRNAGPLETPTSPVLDGHKLCTANSDGNRRDNSPSTDGEIGGPGEPKGKISCLDQRVTIPGRVLPVQH